MIKPSDHFQKDCLSSKGREADTKTSAAFQTIVGEQKDNHFQRQTFFFARSNAVVVY